MSKSAHINNSACANNWANANKSARTSKSAHTNNSAHTNKSGLYAKDMIRWAVGVLLIISPAVCLAGWTNPTSGTADYLDPARWAGGLIDNRFESTLKLTGTLSVKLDSRHSTGPQGLLLGYDVFATSYEFNLVGHGTLVLAGPVNMTPVKSDLRAAIGGALESLRVELEGTCEFNIGQWQRLTIMAPMADGTTPGALLKTGEGHLILSGTNSYSGSTTIRQGRVQLARSEVLPDPGVVELAATAGVLELLAGVSETVGALSGGSTDKGNVILNNASLLVGAADVPAVYRGVISGSGGSLAKIGSATQTFTNVAHRFNGELAVRGGTLSIEAAYSSPEGTIPAAGNSPLGAGPVLIDGGRLSIRNAFADAAVIVMERNISFGPQGGVLEFAGPCRSGAGLGVATAATDALPAAIRYAHGWDPTAWRFGNSFRLTGATGASTIRLELTDGAIATLLAGGSFAPPMVFSGVLGGDCSAATSKLTVGRFGLVNLGQSPATAVFDSGLTFQHAAQLSVDGADCVIGGNVAIAPHASVGVQGGQSRSGGMAWLILGRDDQDVITVGPGAQLNIDSRFRSENVAHGGVHLRSRCVIAPGGLLRLRQSDMAEPGNVGFHRLDGVIEGQGTSQAQSVMEILLGEKSTPGGPDGGVDWNNSSLQFVVNGSGLSGLSLQGPAVYLEAMLRPYGADEVGRLRTLSGNGGYLTLAPTDTTLHLPAGNQWDDPNVGLRVVDSVAGSTDLSLASYDAWTPKLNIDSGATLAVAPAGLALTGIVSGGGEIVGGPVLLRGIHAAEGEMLRAASVMFDGCELSADWAAGHEHSGGDSTTGIHIAQKLHWRGTTTKTGQQTYTLWLDEDEVTIDPGRTLLHIRQGVLAIAGPGDPLSDSQLAGLHLPILNEAQLVIAEGHKHAGDIDGAGSTTIEAGAALTAGFVRQTVIELEAAPGSPARLAFRSSAYLPQSAIAGKPAVVVEIVGDGNLGTVPEPATWLLLGSAMLLMAVFCRHRRWRDKRMISAASLQVCKLKSPQR